MTYLYERQASVRAATASPATEQNQHGEVHIFGQHVDSKCNVFFFVFLFDLWLIAVWLLDFRAWSGEMRDGSAT